jgi:hypothetical protein
MKLFVVEHCHAVGVETLCDSNKSCFTSAAAWRRVADRYETQTFAQFTFDIDISPHFLTMPATV